LNANPKSKHHIFVVMHPLVLVLWILLSNGGSKSMHVAALLSRRSLQQRKPAPCPDSTAAAVWPHQQHSKLWPRAAGSITHRLVLLRQQQPNGNNDWNDNALGENAFYNLAKPVFDLYAGRMVRGDALTKYNTLNQSEPLRINLLLLITFSLLSLPWLLPELQLEEAAVQLTTTQPLVSSLLALGSASATAVLAFIQCQARNRQLQRIEKECALLDLMIRLPNSIFADSAYTSRSMSIRALFRDTTFRRLLVIAGTVPQLQDTLLELQVLGRRLVQSRTCVVVIALPSSPDADLSKATNTTLLARDAPIWRKQYSSADATSATDIFESNGRFPWLLQASDLSTWREFLSSLAKASSLVSLPDESFSSFCWLGLSSSGRSFASGSAPPSWLQIFGKSLPPIAEFDDSNAGAVSAVAGRKESVVESMERELLHCQGRFYEALTQGNVSSMRDTFANQNDIAVSSSLGVMADVTHTASVSDVIRRGGRLDTWETCLADGARPAGLTIADRDVYVFSDHSAYTTCIEFASAASGGETLLAIQQWARAAPVVAAAGEPLANPGTGGWKMALHQTIPWTANAPAAGILMCDGRGCVSLVRRS
jgi:hypothetical protein